MRCYRTDNDLANATGSRRSAEGRRLHYPIRLGLAKSTATSVATCPVAPSGASVFAVFGKFDRLLRFSSAVYPVIRGCSEYGFTSDFKTSRPLPRRLVPNAFAGVWLEARARQKIYDT